MKPVSPATHSDAESSPFAAKALAAFSKWGPILVISLAMVLMFGWTWGRWVDIAEDIGRELYVPWQLALGKVLYRDIAYFNGPLSPYFNALWFRVFGPGFWILAGANCAVIIAVVALVFYVCRCVADRLAAVMACLVFVCVFAFSVARSGGNFSYVAPYSHEMTHGILLCFGLLAALFRYMQTRRLAFFFMMALCAGLLQLTKIEMCLAGLCASLAGLGLALASPLSGGKKWRQLVGLYAAGLLIPLASAFGLLALAMPVAQALKGAIAPFLAVTYEGISSMPFYRIILGMDAPRENLAIMARTAGWYLMVLAPMGAGALFAGRTRGWMAKAGWVLALAAPALVAVMQGRVEWIWIARPYGLLLLLCLVWQAAGWRKSRGNPDWEGVYAVRIVMAVLGMALLPKMLLNQRILLYGFGLGMPATMVLAAALICWIPQAVTRAGGAALAFKVGAVCLILTTVGQYVLMTENHLKSQVHAVGRGLDLMFWDVRGVPFQLFLQTMEKNIPPGKTLAAVPSSAMFNYLSRRTNPTGYLTCIPPEMTMFGQKKILAAYKKTPPDYILLAHHDSAHYGARFFGQDYGRDLFAWIVANYEEIGGLGPRPFQGDAGGYLLLVRRILETGSHPGQETGE